MARIGSYRLALYGAIENAQRCGTADGRAYWLARANGLRGSIATMTRGRVRWS